MPYIKQNDRNKYDYAISNITAQLKDSTNLSGDLNYIISMILKEQIQHRGMSYTTASTLVSALECSKLEFVRRVLDPYEDMKIRENGDVYADIN